MARCGEERRAAEHEQRENPRREQLGGEVVPERQGRQFQESVADDGEATVKIIPKAAVFVAPDAGRQTEVMFGRQVFGNRQRLRCVEIVISVLSVEISPVAAQRHQRGEHERRKRRQRQPAAPFGDERAYGREREHGAGNCSRRRLLAARTR